VPPVLVVVGGLPATGKSTVATLLARRIGCSYLRVDRIEQAIVAWSALAHPVGAVGYAVAYELAGEQLSLGLNVVAECVNPIAVTRDAWVSTADRAGAGIVEVELVCSDSLVHRRRVQTRPSDVAGLVKPSWEHIGRSDYDPWDRAHLVIDTADTPPVDAVEQIASEVAARQRPRGSSPTTA